MVRYSKDFGMLFSGIVTLSRMRNVQQIFLIAAVGLAVMNFCSVSFWNASTWKRQTISHATHHSGARKNDPPYLKVYNLNIHPQQQRQWQLVLSRGGILLTENREEAHVIIGNPDDKYSCQDGGTPCVYAGSMYNGVPQRRAMIQLNLASPFAPGFDRISDFARDSRAFSPWHFTNCKYWITKKESEVNLLEKYSARYGVKPIAMPYFYDDVKVVEGDWNPEAQSEINGYVTGLLERFPDDFVKVWKLKKALEKKRIILHMHGMDVNAIDAGVPHEDSEFLKSKFTMHLKVSEGTYWCNTVARSIAAGIPVITDRATYNIGLFDQMIQHNVSGVIFDDIGDIIHYIETVSDQEYTQLRVKTKEFGFKFRDISELKVDEIKQFFWNVYRDSWFTLVNQDVDCRPMAKRVTSASIQHSCSPPCCTVAPE